MHTLGYSFKPWKAEKSIADGPSIMAYLRETVSEYGIDRHIRFDHLVRRAEWSSDDARWTVRAEQRDPSTGAVSPVSITCSFLFMCSGYYSYTEGYTPEFAGRDDFRGTIVHPQKWPEDLAYAGKRVVVIGSGATAMTLVPAMADTAAHVTMLQRSPTYVVSRPDTDALANRLRSCSRTRPPTRRPVEEHDDAAVHLPPDAHQAREGEGASAVDGAGGAPRLRRRHALHPDVRPLGPAPLPRAEQRPVRGHPLGPGLGRHQPHRPLHRDRHPPRRRDELEADIIVTATDSTW